MLLVQGLQIRAALFRAVRSFFLHQGFLEVDTPVLQPVIIPERNIEPFSSSSWYLQTSPELCMKRLLAGGCEKIFQICNCFRREERGRLHLEEFTMLEWYRKDADYHDLMSDCEKLFSFIYQELAKEKSCAQLLTMPKSILGAEGSFLVKQPWQRLTVEDAFARFSPVSSDQAIKDKSFDEALVEYVEPFLGMETPLFLYDYPVEMASLAKTKENNPEIAERFELYLKGIELANGFSELTDGSEQRQRLEVEIGKMAEAGLEPFPMPERFLVDLDNLDRAAGIAFGLDRLLMLIMAKERLDEAVSFNPDDYT